MGGFLDFFGLTRSLQNKINATAGQLAEGLNGRLERSGFWKGMPTIDFTRKGIPCRITFYNGGAKVPLVFTRFIVHGAAQDKFMRIYSAGFLSRLLKKIGIRGIEIQDPEFDALFVVKSNDPAFVKRRLDPGARHVIKGLYEHQQSQLSDMVDAPDSVIRHAARKDMETAVKIIKLFITPSRPAFEIRYDKKRLCLDVLGLLGQVDKAEALIGGLISISDDRHPSRAE